MKICPLSDRMLEYLIKNSTTKPNFNFWFNIFYETLWFWDETA